MDSKLFLIPTLVSGVIPCSACAAADEEPERVNIVYIMTDDHSYQTLSAYGSAVSKMAPTPNLDRLAARGMLFTRAYVENSISSPSRATLLTGRYSHQHGQIKLGRSSFDPAQTVFPVLLQESGYQTALFGKWHLPVDPRGFDYYKILNGQGTYYNPEFRSPDSDGFVREEGYVARIITDDVMAWLEKRDRNRPFCLMVHHKSIHRNWCPELKYARLYADTVFPEPRTLMDDYSTRCDAARTQTMTIADEMTLASDLKVYGLLPQGDVKSDLSIEISRLSPGDRQRFLEAYAPRNEYYLTHHPEGEELIRWKYQQYMQDYLRCVRSLDDEVGRLLDYLDDAGLSDNTLIIYTSDQGFYMGEHGWFDKRFMYEESFRTPLIISWPGHITPGSVCDALVQNIDYAPTLLDVAGAAVPTLMEGVPLTALFETGRTPENWRDELYYHYWDYPAIHNVRRHDGIATRDFKLIHFKDEGGGNKRKDVPIDAWELYDLREDPSEINNVYGDPRYAEVVDRMKKRLAAKRAELGVDESRFDLEAWKRRK